MQYFIIPDLDGPMSGGTLYNRLLIAALRKTACACEVLPIARAAMALARATGTGSYWVDSLYLDQLPHLAKVARPGTRLGLIVHYLPSLISHGEGIGPEDLTVPEMAALRTAMMFLVPSSFMRGILLRLVGPVRPVLQVEPGRPLPPSSFPPNPPVRAIVVANLVVGKGVERFLASLTEQIGEMDGLHVNIVGGGPDPACAERCQALARNPRLRSRVRFWGEQSPEQTLRVMAASNVLVSCSAMESYGMALMEARVLGIPILAQRGGHVAAMVGPDSGGELFGNAAELVATLVGIARDSAAHCRRMELARARALSARPWSEAACEFVSQVAKLDKNAWPDQGEPSTHEGLNCVG